MTLMAKHGQRTHFFCFGVSVLLVLVACQKAPDTVVSENEQVQNRGSGKDNWYDALPRPVWKRFELVEQSQP